MGSHPTAPLLHSSLSPHTDSHQSRPGRSSGVILVRLWEQAGGWGRSGSPQSVRGQGVGSVSQPDVSHSHSQAHLIQSGGRRGRASGARPPTRDRTGRDGMGQDRRSLTQHGHCPVSGMG